MRGQDILRYFNYNIGFPLVHYLIILCIHSNFNEFMRYSISPIASLPLWDPTLGLNETVGQHLPQIIIINMPGRRLNRE